MGGEETPACGLARTDVGCADPGGMGILFHLESTWTFVYTVGSCRAQACLPIVGYGT